MKDESAAVKALWNDKLPTYRVLNEEGINMENAKVQQSVDGRWLYVDDVDGWSFLDDNEVEYLKSGFELI